MSNYLVMFRGDKCLVGHDRFCSDLLSLVTSVIGVTA